MDFTEVLDAVEPVEVEFLGKKIICHVYSAGYNRLTDAERQIIKPHLDRADERQSRIADIDAEMGQSPSDQRRGELEHERKAIDDDRAYAEFALDALPILLQGIDYDGSAMTIREQGFPALIPDLPNALLLPILFKSLEAWRIPMDAGSQPVDGLPAESADSPIENTTVSENSQKSAAGSEDAALSRS